MLRLSSPEAQALWQSTLWESTPSDAGLDRVRASIPFFGRFRQLEFLGKGGMGKVYKAFDPMLDRTVALKFIHGDDPDLRRRLLIEARAQARMEHENVCKVYEVGEEEGNLYIVMQFIRGKTLRDAGSEMSLLQRVGIMLTVAEAVHEAHRAGLIHRDLKPANIMMEQDSHGDWVPYVMDFGLARVQESTGITLSGMVIGSPHYMSPEQARGEVNKLDQRSDVYSLGVTLYELLSGRRPFEEETSVQLLVKVIYHDPPPLKKRDPSLPADLETIVMKCLEKDPERRYQSAGALAEDLRRYLDGDPITARPAGPLYRIYKKAIKNRTVSAVILVSLVLILIAGATALQTQWKARQQVLVAHRFGLEVKEMESILRNAHTMPLHNISRERELVLARMKQIEGQIGEVGSAGYGPCHYALGRSYLALQDYVRAKEHLELAWNSGYREPTVAYSLGQVLGARYSHELERVKWGAKKEGDLEEVQKMYRDPALQYLKMTRGSSQVEAPSYIEGLIAFYDNRHGEALRKAAQAFQAVPWLYEAKKLEGDIFVLMGTQLRDAGEYEKSASEFERAGKAFAAAIDMGRSDPALYVSECGRWILVMELEQARGSASEQSFRQAVAFCDKALQAFPKNSAALDKKAWAYWRWGEYQSFRGQDPTETLSTAIELGQRALSIDPKYLDVWMRLGAAYDTLGEYQMQHGLDPRNMLQKAIAGSREMIRTDANHPYAYNLLGYAALTTAEYEIKIGLDPRSSLGQAIGGFQKTIQFDPKFSQGFNNLAYTYLTRGGYEMNHGLDARPSLDQSVGWFQEAIRVNPNYASAFSNLGIAWIRKAQYQFQHGENPLPLVEKAIQACRHSLELNEQSAFTYNILSFCYLLSAEYEVTLNQDPSSDLDQSLQAAKTALRHKPNLENAFINMIRACIAQGTYELAHGRSPADAVRQARRILDQLKKIYPASIPVREAAVDLLEAKWAAQKRMSPLNLLDRASQSLRITLQGNARNAENCELLAELLQQKAQWEIQHKTSADESIRQGLEAANQALKLNPKMAEAYAVRGLLLVLQSHSAHGSPKNGEDAVSALTTALQINRNLSYLYGPALEKARMIAR